LSQWPLWLGVRPVALELLLHGLPTFVFDEERTWTSLPERSLQYGGDIPWRCLLDVSLASHLGDHRLILDLVGRKATTKLL